MSTEQQQPNAAPAGMWDPETSVAVVKQSVYNPVFFTKLAADYNIHPQTEQEALEILDQTAHLRAAHDQDIEKAGSNQSSMLSLSRQHLGQVMGRELHDGQNDVLVKSASAEVAQTRPDVAHAILSLQAAAAGVQPAAPAA